MDVLILLFCLNMVSSSGSMKKVSKVVEKCCLDTGDTISLDFSP